MILSMTGYGKGQAMLQNGQLTVEIRTLNAKGADISIKSSLLPKEKEMEVRKLLMDKLVRGTIDLYLTYEPNDAQTAGHCINQDIFHSYWQSAVKALDKEGIAADSMLANAVLRLPDVVEARKADAITPEDWPAVEAALKEALEQLCRYRATEGEALYKDVTGRVAGILRLYDQVEALEAERIVTVREKLTKSLDELGAKVDPSRFEQELVFYLEKYDINEEKVRLRQHC